MTEEQPKLPVLLRQWRETDVGYVVDTWLKHYHDHGVGMVRGMPRGEFFRRWRSVVVEILKTADVRVACLDDDDDIILGFAVLSTHCGARVLHWVHVREDWRRKGLGAQLLAGLERASVLYTHRTRTVVDLSEAGKIPGAWHHAPWLLVGMGAAEKS